MIFTKLTSRIAATAACLAVALTTAAWSDESVSEGDLKAASQALELRYILKPIYPAVRCDRRYDHERGWVFCTSVGGDGTIGGLYLVEPGPVIWAVNGKAIQHMGVQDGETSITSTEGSAIAVRRWRGAPLAIPAIIDGFSR